MKENLNCTGSLSKILRRLYIGNEDFANKIFQLASLKLESSFQLSVTDIDSY
jgi:hypothetical protein